MIILNNIVNWSVSFGGESKDFQPGDIRFTGLVLEPIIDVENMEEKEFNINRNGRVLKITLANGEIYLAHPNHREEIIKPISN